MVSCGVWNCLDNSILVSLNATAKYAVVEIDSNGRVAIDTIFIANNLWARYWNSIAIVSDSYNAIGWDRNTMSRRTCDFACSYGDKLRSNTIRIARIWWCCDCAAVHGYTTTASFRVSTSSKAIRCIWTTMDRNCTAIHFDGSVVEWPGCICGCSCSSGTLIIFHINWAAIDGHLASAIHAVCFIRTRFASIGNVDFATIEG